MRAKVSMREALADDRLLGQAIPGPSWFPWRTLLIAALGEPLTDEEREVFAELTGREREPSQQVEEFWGVTGRRSGKTRSAGVLACYVGGLCDHRSYLASGERALIPVLAASTTQATRAFMHISGVLQASPVLAQELDGDPAAGTIRLRTRCDIEIRAASFKTIRGVTAAAAICDEAAFWHIEGSANPDTEVLNALRPALATTGGPLWVITTPHAKRGEVHATFRKHHGPQGDPAILVVNAPSQRLNSTLPDALIRRAYERDASLARAEYGGQFRDDIEEFASLEIVELCVMPGCRELPPVQGVAYRAFVDPSGGSSDSFTLAIAHKQDDMVVIDLLAERRPPFSPETVTQEFAGLLKRYGLSRVVGDRYAGEWPREQFRKRGVEYRTADLNRTELYQGLLPLLTSGLIALPDDPRLVGQITSLERRMSRSGRELIDHGISASAHDDLSNAVAGVAALCLKPAVRVWTADQCVGSYSYFGNWNGACAVGRDADRLPPPQYGPGGPQGVFDGRRWMKDNLE